MTPAELIETVPFAHRADLEVVHAEPGHVVVRIPNERKNQNHVGTVHAAALVLVGETAGGLTILNEPRLAGYLLLAKGLSIRYRRPGATGVSAAAHLPEAAVLATVEAVERDGKVDLPLAVAMHDEAGVLVAELQVDFHLRKRG
jgi:acyl-coenzyme A thioesterase PaaI-like protein